MEDNETLMIAGWVEALHQGRSNSFSASLCIEGIDLVVSGSVSDSSDPAQAIIKASWGMRQRYQSGSRMLQTDSQKADRQGKIAFLTIPRQVPPENITSWVEEIHQFISYWPAWLSEKGNPLLQKLSPRAELEFVAVHPFIEITALFAHWPLGRSEEVLVKYGGGNYLDLALLTGKRVDFRLEFSAYGRIGGLGDVGRIFSMFEEEMVKAACLSRSPDCPTGHWDARQVTHPKHIHLQGEWPANIQRQEITPRIPPTVRVAGAWSPPDTLSLPPLMLRYLMKGWLVNVMDIFMP